MDAPPLLLLLLRVQRPESEGGAAGGPRRGAQFALAAILVGQVAEAMFLRVGAVLRREDSTA